MTIHLAPIQSDSVRSRHDHSHLYHIRFFQMYANAHKPELIDERKSYWTGKSYLTETALHRDLADKQFCLEMIANLKRDAIEKVQDGMVVIRTVVAFGSPWEEGYAFDKLDPRHLKRAYENYAHKPVIGKKPHLAWNPTKDEDWVEKLDEGRLVTLKNLKERTKHLEALTHKGSESEIAKEFAWIAPTWIEQRKGLERVGHFFLSLMIYGKHQAHRECLDVWGSLILKEPDRLYEHLCLSHTQSQVLKKGEANPEISAQDHFETINTLLAMFPDTCLSGNQLLSGEWLRGLQHEDFRDAAMIALLSGYARYQKMVYKHDSQKAARENPDATTVVTEERVCQEFFRRVEASVGVDIETLLDRMGAFPEGGSRSVNTFFKLQLETRNEGMHYNKTPLPIALQAATARMLRLVPQPLSILLKANLMGHPAQSGAYVSKMPKDQDREYFERLIRHPRITLPQLKNMMPYSHFERVDIDLLEEINPQMAREYLAGMNKIDLKLQLSRGNVPVHLLTKGKHRDQALSTDLGL